MKKKILFGLGAAALSLVALAGCDNNTPAEGGSGAPAEKQVELKTVSMFGGADEHGPVYQKLIKEYMAEHKNVTVTDNSNQSDEIWKTSVISSFYSGTQPDVLFYFTGAQAAPLVNNNLVVSIDEIRKEYPDYAKNIADSVLFSHAVTLKGMVEGMFVNTDLLKNNGLEEYANKDTWTWDELTAVCTGLQQANITPFAFGGTDEPHYFIEHLLLSMVGQDAFTNLPKAEDMEAANGSGTTVSDKWHQGLNMFKTIADAGWFGANKGLQGQGVAADQFKKGQAALHVNGSWFAGQLKKNEGVNHTNVKMIPFPAVPNGSGKLLLQSGFTSGFFISRKAWNDPAKRDAAVKFVEKMTSTQAITEYCTAVAAIPADSKVKLGTPTPLEISMNTMSARTQGSTVPLSDLAKKGSFNKLVEKVAAYVNGQSDIQHKALVDFITAQK